VILTISNLAFSGIRTILEILLAAGRLSLRVCIDLQNRQVLPMKPNKSAGYLDRKIYISKSIKMFENKI
jgi:hypothetical protein